MADWDVDNWLDGFRAKRTSVQVCQRGDLLDEHARLERELARARAAAADDLFSQEVVDAAARLEEIEQLVSESQVTFVFEALSARAWQDLVRRHPPRRDAAEDREIGANADTFPDAAIAACAVEPVLTEDQAVRLADALPLGEWRKLWQAVLTVNAGDARPPKSALAAAIGARLQSERSSTTAAPVGSRGRSSSGSRKSSKSSTSATKRAG